MRVLILHNAGSSKLPSGEALVAEQETRALKARGVTVRLEFVYNDEIDTVGAVGRAAAALNLFWSRPAYRRVSALVKEFRPDVVHFHGILPILTVSAVAACKDLGVPVVQTLHNYRWFCVEGGLYRDGVYCDACLHGGPLTGVRHRCSRGSLSISTLLTLNNALWVRRGKLFDRVDRFLTVSEFVRQKHLEAGFPPERVVTKPNGIDLGKLPDRLVPAAERSGVVFVGRLTPAKGISVLARMLPMIRGTQIEIVGDGPEYGALAQAVSRHGLDEVTLHGRVAPERALSIIGHAACAVAPSMSAETFNLVAVESLGLGTPLVASRIGGLAEIVEGSGGGVTVTPGDARSFVAAIREICASPERVGELGRQGRAHVERHFTAEQSVQRLLEIYRDVMEAA